MGDVLESVVAVAVVVVEDGRLLALRRSAHREAGAGVWEVVSGRVRAGEDPADAAVREAHEETGFEVDLVQRPVDAYAARRGATTMMVLVYVALVAGGTFCRSDEHDAHRWVTPDELASMGSPPRLVEAVRRALGVLGG